LFITLSRLVLRNSGYNLSVKKFPVLEVKGTYIDIGRAIGEEFKSTIQDTIAKRKVQIANYNSYLSKVSEYFNFTKSIFPNLIVETEAIAKSANVDVLDYFFINCCEVYDISEQQDKIDAANHDHCTIVVSFNRNGAIVGHNEDWQNGSPEKLFILKVTNENGSFISLSYKNCIAGNAASMNNFGLVQCINDLNPVSQFGVPQNYLARAVLECETLDEAESLIRNTKRASGFNHVLVQGREVRNIEIAADQIAVERSIENAYVHTNHYTSLEMQVFEKFHTNSSEARYQRARELVKNEMTFVDAKDFLSDTQNIEYPICRADATLGSVIAIPQRNEFWACYSHPCAGEYFQYLN